MSKIVKPISKQLFETIRDRTLIILVDEFESQHLLTYDPDLEIVGYVNRSTPFDKVELTTLNVSLSTGVWSNKNQGSVDGAYQFNIDFYCSAKSKEGEQGDTISGNKLEKLLGVARAILEDPVYKTLGFVPPFIMKSFVSEVNIATPNKEDAKNTGMGRLTFNVVANETSKLIEPKLIEGYETRIRIDNTGKGYFYQGENYQ